MNSLFRFLLLTLMVTSISACALRPDASERFQHVDSEQVQRHQERLVTIQEWHIRGRLAFIDTIENNRDAASLSWSHSSDSQRLRIYHPLRGTLAQLTVNVTEEGQSATLMTPQGESHRASNVEQLLAQHAGIHLPYHLIHQAVLGQKPTTGTTDIRYFEDGTVAQYRYSDWRTGEQWHVELGHYRLVPYHEGSVLMPHLIDVEQYGFNLKLQINQWNLEP